MKKIALIITCTLCVVLFFSSCRKCSTCEYKYEYYNGGIWEPAKQIKENCGNSHELNAFEKSFKAEALKSERKKKGHAKCYISG